MIALTRSIFAAVLSLGLITTGALAAGSGWGTNTSTSQNQDSDYAAAQKAIEAGKFEKAVALLERSVGNSDACASASNSSGCSASITRRARS